MDFSYTSTLKNCPRFTADEERRLCRRAKRGDMHAREQLILSQLPWAVRLAKRYVGRNASFEDMIQLANVGVIIAVDTLDPRKGRLSTNAGWRIKAQCLRYCREHTTPGLKMPSTTTANTRPLVDALKGRPYAVFNGKFDLPGPPAAELDDVDHDDERERLRQAISTLNPRLRYVIERRLAGETLATIGKSLGVTQERVRQIEADAIEQLQTLLTDRQFLSARQAA